VTTILGHVGRYDDEVGQPNGDLLRATRTEIGLARLKGVDERDFEIVGVVAQPNAAHSTRRTTISTAAATNK
jgi:hypothetical protein